MLIHAFFDFSDFDHVVGFGSVILGRSILSNTRKYEITLAANIFGIMRIRKLVAFRKYALRFDVSEIYVFEMSGFNFWKFQKSGCLNFEVSKLEVYFETFE